MVLLGPSASADDPLWAALSAGKVDFSARYRYEHVDDDLRPKDADASTLRTTLGYTTGMFAGFGVRLLIQDVRDVGIDDFDDGTRRPGSKTDRAVVVDPSETDFLEAYLSYSGLKETTLKLGRQIITYRPPPLHRFMGTVLWRQNWQNHDAFTVENRAIDGLVLHYAYSWNVNRIFTDEAAIDSLANFDSNSHFINAQYSGLPWGELEGYAYLLDFDNAEANSTQTYGVRFSGARKINESLKGLYALEYAHEWDYADNPASIDANYFLGEAGLAIAFEGPVRSITLKFDYELLGGKGGADRFITPLATLHPFQGWADRFLDTPQDGIEDVYVSVIVDVLGAKFLAMYHDLNSDNLGYDYGKELDLQLTKTFKKHYTFGLKYSDYEADRNAVNLARNGVGSVSPRATVINDVSKFWAWVAIKF
jgi:hypothetical protein